MIVVENLVKSYNSTVVLHSVCHSQQRGEAVVVIGPSGCGKSTFLRCLNHLEVADSGRITIGGVTIEGGHRPHTSEERERHRYQVERGRAASKEHRHGAAAAGEELHGLAAVEPGRTDDPCRR